MKNESAHVANRSQCKTEDSCKHLEIQSMGRGFLACGTDADLVMNTMLIQKLHSVAEARQVSHEAPEPRAVSCALENLDANGLGRVLLEGDVGSAQTFVDPIWVGRGERMMAEMSSRYWHQSNGAGENDVREIESSAKTNGPVLPEEFGCRAQQQHCSAVGCWMCGARAPSVREALQRTRSVEYEIRDVLTQEGGTVDHGDERGKMATLDRGRATGTPPGWHRRE